MKEIIIEAKVLEKSNGKSYAELVKLVIFHRKLIEYVFKWRTDRETFTF